MGVTGIASFGSRSEKGEGKTEISAHQFDFRGKSGAIIALAGDRNTKQHVHTRAVTRTESGAQPFGANHLDRKDLAHSSYSSPRGRSFHLRQH